MTNPLIEVPELADLLSRGSAPTLLDVRWSLAGPSGRAEYDAGHLPGAQFVDLDTELAGPSGARGRHPLPEPDAFVAAMRAHGVSRRRDVVVYDQRDGTSAARAWWLLRHYGHRGVRVLDGGLDAWRTGGHPIQQETVSRGPGDFDGRPGTQPVLEVDDVLDFAARHTLLDARAVERYRGEHEPVDPVAGHIPAALSAPTTDNVRRDGMWRDAGELRERLGSIVAADRCVGVYCGSGVTAAHQVLALEIAGLRAALYPGSWSEWVADPDRPVATG